MDDTLLKETIVLLAADIYPNVYKHAGEHWGDAVSEIIGLAEQFEEELDWKDDDDRDYILELENFERRVLDSFND